MLSPMLQCCTFNEQGNTGPLYQHFCKTVTQMTIISPNKQFLVVIPLLQLGELKSLHLSMCVRACKCKAVPFKYLPAQEKYFGLCNSQKVKPKYTRKD